MSARCRIEPTEHCRLEWARFAQAAYRNGHNATGHRFSGAAALRNGDEIPIATYNSLQNDYRAWLCFDEYPKVQS